VIKLWKSYWDQTLVSMKKKKKKKKKLNIFNQIIKNLEKYIWSVSQDEFLDYYIRDSYDIEKMIALE